MKAGYPGIDKAAVRRGLDALNEKAAACNGGDRPPSPGARTLRDTATLQGALSIQNDRGAHVHLCVACGIRRLCENECSGFADDLRWHGIPDGEPLICDRCKNS